MITFEKIKALKKSAEIAFETQADSKFTIKSTELIALCQLVEDFLNVSESMASQKKCYEQIIELLDDIDEKAKSVVIIANEMKE